MAQVGTKLSYTMPETGFAVSATKRMTISQQIDGSHLTPVVDVEMTHSPVTDPTNRRTLAVEPRFLEKIALSVTLDESALITAVNSEASRDISPVISLVGKAISFAASVGIFKTEGVKEDQSRPHEEKLSLEQQWATTHCRLDANLKALLSQVDRLLLALSDVNASHDAIVSVGRALDAVQSQVASISQVRRDWIVAKAGKVDKAKVLLRPFDLLRLQDTQLPARLPEPAIPPLQASLADEFGCLLAVIDQGRRVSAAADDGRKVDTNLLRLRHSRQVTVGVYLKGDDDWELDQETVQNLNIVDRFSEESIIPIKGNWFRTKGFELAFHPDMSVKTFGVNTASSGSAVSTSLGDVFDAAAAAREVVAKRPSAADEELAAAKTKLDLLKAATEYEVLSATRERAATVALAEQLAKLGS